MCGRCTAFLSFWRIPPIEQSNRRLANFLLRAFKVSRFSSLNLWSVCAALVLTPVRGQISGNFTLSGNQSFTSSSSLTYQIGSSSANSFNLQGYTATLTGSGNFSVGSQITGAGQIVIDLTDSSKVVTYNSGNSYSGLTTVRSGTLFLGTPENQNNAILGNMIIGGGPNVALVTRDTQHNRELVGNNSTITLRQNGTFELNRADTGSSSVHDSLETIGGLVMDGGTLLNGSPNSNPTTINVGTLTLLANSTIDLGTSMIVNLGNVDMNTWTSGATLTVSNWNAGQHVYFGDITAQQLSQIRFATSTGYVGASAIVNGEIVPTTTVPEISVVMALPLLGGFILAREIKNRRSKRTS
jgi:hypothetical protein